MASEKKKVVYRESEEQLINAHEIRENVDNFSLIRELFSRVRICEAEIIRMQRSILSVSEEESIKKMKERWQKYKDL